MGVKRTILIVEDEKDIRELVRFHLEQEGYAVREADSGERALAQVAAERPALVVLDLMLPAIDGLEVCRRLRASEATRTLPVIMLTAKAAEVDRVLGLELGADDYVVKPFSPRELAARVRAVLRRTVRSDAGAHDLLFGELRIDLVARRVFVRGERVELTAREFDLLAFLASSPRHVFSRAEVLEHVWRSAAEWQDPATVTEHVRRLRVKLEDDRENPRWIRTVRAKGYSFEP